jgi:periplasmic divalent cation tolerance protein
MASPVLIVLCTFPEGDRASAAARTLVEEKLAACVNLVPQIRSIYRWQGEVCDDREELAIVKTTADRFPALRERLVALHPYDCPEVLALPVEDGHPPYLAWVVDGTRP